MTDGHKKKMLIGLTSGNGYGFQPGAWRTLGVDPTNYTSYDPRVRHAQSAERGKFQFIFLPDGPFTDHSSLLETEAPNFNLHEPLSKAQLEAARPSPYDPRSSNALKVAKEGWSLQDIIAHGIIDYHPAIVGPGIEAADHMQAWFEAGACDGFWISPDILDDGIDAFVDEVVPILQERGLFHDDYEGSTLREHIGAPEQYGIDSRV